MAEAGAGWLFGRRLPELLRAAGLADVQFEARVRADRPGEYRRTHLLALVEPVKPTNLARGLLREAELADLAAAPHAHLADPHTVVVRHLLFQAWGRKP